MKEELLHYIWKTKSFSPVDLRTTENEQVHIEKFGIYNLNAGPDFLEGQIKLQETYWAGHIEMHLLSSDWIRHKHELDQSYQNVILHVVWEEDEIIYRNNGTRIPCIEMKDLIPQYLIDSYANLTNRSTAINCSTELPSFQQDFFRLQMDKLFVERLEQKCLPISLELENYKQDWSQVLFLLIARAMGLQVNADGMEAMARTIPIKLIARHRESLHQLEALFYGQAGMLAEKWKDNYPQDLYQEYKFLRTKYNLQAISGNQWKLMRMRPTSFPTIRIAQLAFLYNKLPNLHTDIMNANSFTHLVEIFSSSTSEYWDTHYLFDRKAGLKEKKLGSAAINSIIINAIVPFYFAYGQYRSDDMYVEKAIKFMQEVPAENNKLIREWKSLQVSCKSALESQALIHLYKNYCLKNRCLECSYGSRVLRSISSKVQEEEHIYKEG